MYAPARDDEITGLIAYLDQQLEAVRAAPVGLTDEQARHRPCRSALSVGGIVKHVTQGMAGVLDRLAGRVPTGYDAEAFAHYQVGFVVGSGEAVADVLTAFDEIRPRYLAGLAALDPGAEIIEQPAPWDGIPDARPVNARYLVVHQIEEMARHAGHADILREQIDGVAVPAIVATRAGVAAGEFFQPYRPAPGTIGAE